MMRPDLCYLTWARRLLLAVTCTAALWAQQAPKPVHNDDMYPATGTATRFISFDNAGFSVNGQREYLSSGTVHYSRVPHELWEDRLLRLKQGSFAAVETYAFWNFQEPRENQFDFTGDKDLGRFLDTAQRLGLYATVRVGPYVCAEWDSGGYPVWLRFKPPFKLRTDDAAWLAWNDHWYAKILPLVASHQISHGGNVIMVQLENEHPLGWGVVPNDPYFEHLHQDAVKWGIDVPSFMSGMNHGGAPSPPNLSPATRATPWITTEFWAGWFDSYRTLADKKNREIERANWTILAHGGAGHNFYMLHGGTNFDAWSDDSTGASYDFGAAIGQAGDLRPSFYKMKRANQLAQSFPEILGNSTDALPAFADYATGTGVKVLGARQSRSGGGTLIFLENAGSNTTTATLKTGDTLQLSRFGNYPLPVNAVIAKGMKIASSTLPILGVAHNGAADTVVFYGQPGESGRVALSATDALQPGPGCKDFLTSANPFQLSLRIPTQSVAACELKGSERTLRILAINKDLSLYTWFVGDPGRKYVVLGPAFVQSVDTTAGRPAAIIERPYGQPAPGHVALYGGPGEAWHLAAQGNRTLEPLPAPPLAGWTMAPAPEVSPTFNDAAWTHSDNPLQMGADGDYGAFAWYRAKFEATAAGAGELHLQGADNLEVFVNGQHVSYAHGVAQATLRAGTNTLAVLVSHHGRNKDYNYLGTLDTHDSKGLIGPATLQSDGRTLPIAGWSMRGGVESELSGLKHWAPPANTQGIPAFYRTTFLASPPAALGAHPILRVNFAGLSRGMVWVNGHSLGRYPEKIRVDSLYIPECWLTSGKNVLTVFDETGSSAAGVHLVIEQATSRELLRVSTAIDAATPIVVPPENPLGDLAALNRGNLAFGKPATASVAASDSAATFATDGDPDTLWSAPYGTPNPSVRVDLEKPTPIGVAEILWEQSARGYQYALEGSIDGDTWTKLGDQTTAVPTSADSPSELSRLNLSGASFRYVRVTIRAGRSRSIAEIRLFAPAS